VSDSALGVATASDNSGNATITRSGVPAGNIFPVGVTTITYTATDASGNSASATQTVTVIDNTAPILTAPAPTTVQADSSGQALIPNVASAAIASDNCGPVSVMQSPAEGTVVGVGTHTITLTATDAAGNTKTATTTFTVIAAKGGLTFTFSVTPATVQRGSMTRLNIFYSNDSGAAQRVTFDLRYTDPCGNAVLDNIGPISMKSGVQDSKSIPFHVPKNACTGVYTLTLEYNVEGVMVGSTTARLTVIP